MAPKMYNEFWVTFTVVLTVILFIVLFPLMVDKFGRGGRFKLVWA